MIGLFCSGALFGALEDHFREAGAKSGGSQVEGVDFIYMINLDERSEKFQTSLEQLQPYGITPYRFSAVNGWKLTPEEINDVGVKYGPGMRERLPELSRRMRERRFTVSAMVSIQRGNTKPSQVKTCRIFNDVMRNSSASGDVNVDQLFVKICTQSAYGVTKVPLS